MKKILMVILLVVVSPLWAASDNWSKEKTITVQGEGKSSAPPDQASFTVEVQKQGSSSKVIVAAANALMNQVLAKLKDFNIPSKDFQTEGYSVDQNYEYTNGKSKPAGYTVTNRLKVIVQQIDQLQDVVGALSDMESIQVDGPTFGFSKPNQLQSDALKDAMTNAHAEAVALAEAAGVQLGPVYSITQKTVNSPVFRPVMRMELKSTNASPAPVEEGTNEVTAQVEVVYTLK